ncbi:hypothetical protein CROQUDRAFT_98334 [Cronartium quercuum f. sp. fusiforme G11]|uniref:Secreted protein n=1 Tax=Cronartium quercuum f. sp. fusiforme G11 TaxID=708437 RepID=A0A9P6T8R9_9BASI|nr:hypothetical protein CROQUDRAFT_98334 [Cronartium quercuum f. sp. fusiforme G11]
MLLHLVSAVIAILQFSSVFSAGGDPAQLAKRAQPVAAKLPPPLYTQCKGVSLHDRCNDVIEDTWKNQWPTLQLFTPQHLYRAKNGCKVTWWTSPTNNGLYKYNGSVETIFSAFSELVDPKCPDTKSLPTATGSGLYRNVFVGSLDGSQEVVIMLDSDVP